MTIVKTEISGQYGYEAAYTGPQSVVGTEPAHPFGLLRGTPVDANAPIILKVQVSADTPMIVGSVTDANGNFPAGLTSVFLLDPSGAVREPITPSSTSPDFVSFNGQMLYCFAISKPSSGAWEGEWTLTAFGVNTDSYIYCSTLPTDDAYATICAAITPYIDSSLLPGEGAVTNCTICKIASYTIAAVVAILVPLGVILLTAEAAPVVAVATFVGVSATASSFMLKAVVQLVGKVVKDFVENMCGWVGACSTGMSDVEIISPISGAYVSKQLPITASAIGAADVSIWRAGSKIVELSPNSDEWYGWWDTTTVPNGPQALSAVGRFNGKTQWSPVVQINVRN